MHDLAVLLLGSVGGSTHNGGIRAVRLRAIKDDILSRVGEPSLSIGDIVKSQQISESYIRQLLADQDTTFTDFVLDQRLQRAHRMLTGPDSGTLRISAIAYEAGFGDLSYFNRTFRRRYGAAPSNVRSVARLKRLQLTR
jgi:AraC-like DNA-binding protein